MRRRTTAASRGAARCRRGTPTATGLRALPHDGRTRFFNERLLGLHRRALLAADLSTACTDAAAEQQRRIDALRRSLATNKSSRTPQSRTHRRSERRPGYGGQRSAGRAARTEYTALTGQLGALERSREPELTPELLDALSQLALDVERLPESLARAGSSRRSGCASGTTGRRTPSVTRPR